MTFGSLSYDVCIIGGGVNGTGIARDLAGRGLRVGLFEQGDLAQGTSSASTKLIHGGLRYLETYEFKLVREALKERNVLLKAAPHIVWPMRFILPYEPHLRPKWLLRAGLFLYDVLAKRDKRLKGSNFISLNKGAFDDILSSDISSGFVYSDCWVEDSRLVVLNAMAAKEKGAQIKTYSKCIRAERRGKLWVLTIEDQTTGHTYCISTKCVINAAGPWAQNFLENQGLFQDDQPRIRLVKGSHIIVPKFYDHDHAYIIQQRDGRIMFVIPYEYDFTLIGTTEEVHNDTPSTAQISGAEIDYLCASVNRIFKAKVSLDSIISTYSGVRPLIEDGEADNKNVSRGYKIEIRTKDGKAPLVNIYGGKITTFRTLSEKLSNKVCALFDVKAQPWTKKEALPGGDLGDLSFQGFVEAVQKIYPFLAPHTCLRLCRAYGARAHDVLGKSKSIEDLGVHFGAGFYERELIYMIEQEMAITVDDVLWRRSKLGLHMNSEAQEKVAAFIESYQARVQGA